MERDLIIKIKELIDNEPDLADANWFVNLLNDYVCTFNYDNKDYVITIMEVIDNEIN
jgi:hypothetical protein